jgi:mannose-6-phosphate isomerase-like protein (cupin superfamily)
MGANEVFVNKPSKRIGTGSLNRIGEIKLTRWKGAQHPTLQAITKQMEVEGLRPYSWSNGPNFRIAARSHGYTKIMYVVEGSLELVITDINQSVILRPGDRLELPRGMRHSTIVGPNGVRCVESAK